MAAPTLAEKQQQILAHEETLARQLALAVLEKPTPPIWMILIPIFFIFFAWKLKQYSRGLEDFSHHYLISRRRALQAAITAEETGKKVDLNALLEAAQAIPEAAKPLYRDWLSLLTDHYRSLLAAHGASHAALVRACYRDKTSYLLCCTSLARAELAFSKALVPEMQGNTDDLRDVIERMEKALAQLHRQESEQIFG